MCLNTAQTVLAKVHKVIADGHTDKSLDEILVHANVTFDDCTEAIEVSNKEVLCCSSVNLVNAW